MGDAQYYQTLYIFFSYTKWLTRGNNLKYLKDAYRQSFQHSSSELYQDAAVDIFCSCLSCYRLDKHPAKRFIVFPEASEWHGSMFYSVAEHFYL